MTSLANDTSRLAREPWTLRAAGHPFLVRPSQARDLAALAAMHRRCSPHGLLDRYRCGGRPPAVGTLDRMLRSETSFVVVAPTGSVVASGSVARDAAHSSRCAEVGVLVEDAWQMRGIGSALMGHLAGSAQAVGFGELIAYPATAVAAAQRLMIGIGRTRMVPEGDMHLHTYLPESAALGLGAVRERLAG